MHGMHGMCFKLVAMFLFPLRAVPDLYVSQGLKINTSETIEPSKYQYTTFRTEQYTYLGTWASKQARVIDHPCGRRFQDWVVAEVVVPQLLN